MSEETEATKMKEAGDSTSMNPEMVEIQNNKGQKLSFPMKPITEAIMETLTSQAESRMAEQTGVDELQAKITELENANLQLAGELDEAKQAVTLAEVSAEDRQAFFSDVIPDAAAYIELGKEMGFLEVEDASDMKEEDPKEPVPAKYKALEALGLKVKAG